MQVWFFPILCFVVAIFTKASASDESNGDRQEILSPRTQKTVAFNSPYPDRDAHRFHTVRAHSDEVHAQNICPPPHQINARRVFSDPIQSMHEINDTSLQSMQFDERQKHFENIGKTYFFLPIPQDEDISSEKIVYPWHPNVFKTLKLEHVFDVIEATSSLRRTHILLFICGRSYSVTDEQTYLHTIPGFSRSTSHRIEHFTRARFLIPGYEDPYTFSWESIETPCLSHIFSSIANECSLNPLMLQCVIRDNTYGDSCRLLRLSRIPGFYQTQSAHKINIVEEKFDEIHADSKEPRHHSKKWKLNTKKKR